MSLPFYGEREATTKNVNGKVVTDTIYHSIPAFQFINQNGDTVSDKNYKGRIYVADFFFTSCKSICPKMSANLAVVQDKFKDIDSVFILSHTVNPDNDTPEKLKTYAQLVHADLKKWTFVTGSKHSIYDIAIHGYMLPAGEDVMAEGGFLHSEQLILVDKEKHIRGIYDGTSLPDVNKLIDDIKLLKADYIVKEEKRLARQGK